MSKQDNTPTYKVRIDQPDLYEQIHLGLVNLLHLAGVFVYGALALALLGLAAFANDAILGMLMAAAAAGAAWLSQSFWALQKQQPAQYCAFSSAALGAASAILTYLGA